MQATQTARLLRNEPPQAAGRYEILRNPDVCRRLRISPSSLRTLVLNGHIAQPFRLPNMRAVFWTAAAIDEFIELQSRKAA